MRFFFRFRRNVPRPARSWPGLCGKLGHQRAGSILEQCDRRVRNSLKFPTEPAGWRGRQQEKMTRRREQKECPICQDILVPSIFLPLRPAKQVKSDNPSRRKEERNIGQIRQASASTNGSIQRPFYSASQTESKSAADGIVGGIFFFCKRPILAREAAEEEKFRIVRRLSSGNRLLFRRK